MTLLSSIGECPITARRSLNTRSGKQCRLPVFFPVYQPNNTSIPIAEWGPLYGVEGCIVNAFFLYKDRPTRALFEQGATIQSYIGFDGIVMTDSGAFQGFSRRLFLENKTIVAFQNKIGADIVSPLDLVTPPGDNRATAERKLNVTLARIQQAIPLATRGTLAGVQQGGRFLDLRRRSLETLVALDVAYLAIGSLVPFFTRNHDLFFAGTVLREARRAAGDRLPIHVFGAGDPLELPFLTALGADIFDSSSYAHYANAGWYMTPYGAVQNPAMLADFRCRCHVCGQAERIHDVFASAALLAAHNLWTILDAIRGIREALASNTLDALLSSVLAQHAEWFPESSLLSSWSRLLA